MEICTRKRLWGSKKFISYFKNYKPILHQLQKMLIKPEEPLYINDSEEMQNFTYLVINLRQSTKIGTFVVHGNREALCKILERKMNKFETRRNSRVVSDLVLRIFFGVKNGIVSRSQLPLNLFFPQFRRYRQDR